MLWTADYRGPRNDFQEVAALDLRCEKPITKDSDAADGKSSRRLAKWLSSAKTWSP
jgi:hypothetical protein